ncbi:MAG: hypothetical protein JSW33_01390 [bacterium]|nr:MAG: hypothetical protein JSW33_01390 [bacterium]
MISVWLVLSLVHLFGLAFGVGAATVKITLLLKSNSNPEFVPTYLQVMRPITRIIILGLALLTLSGIGWILLGTSFTPLFIVKIILVFAVWVLGPIIDNVMEPAFKKLAPQPGTAPTPDFLRAQKRLLVFEILATLLFYIIIVMGVLL